MPDDRQLNQWLQSVITDWNIQWRSRPDHRYGKDLAAFIGERLLTDFNLRQTPGLFKAEGHASQNRKKEE